MRIRGTILALALGLPGLAAAETAARMTEGICAASWAAFVDLADLPDATMEGSKPVVSPQGWCRVEGLQLDANSHVVTEIRRFDWRGEGLDRLIGQGLPPTALEVRINDIRNIPTPGDPLTEYFLRVQSVRNGIDIDGAAHWDAWTKRLILDRLTVDFPGDNAIAATFVIDKVDLSSSSLMQTSVGTMALSDLTLDITSHGLFETFALMPLGSLVLGESDDPESKMAELKRRAGDVIDALPGASFPAPTRAALSALAADMPNPAGRFQLHIAAPEGFGAARFAGFALTGPPRTLAEAMPILDGVTVDASYQRSTGAAK